MAKIKVKNALLSFKAPLENHLAKNIDDFLVKRSTLHQSLPEIDHPALVFALQNRASEGDAPRAYRTLRASSIRWNSQEMSQ